MLEGKHGNGCFQDSRQVCTLRFQKTHNILVIALQIVLLNFRQELSILAEAKGRKSGVDDCSDVMVKKGDPSSAFLGHNEDNTYDTVNTSYFVQATLVSASAEDLCCFALQELTACLAQDEQRPQVRARFQSPPTCSICVHR